MRGRPFLINYTFYLYHKQHSKVSTSIAPNCLCVDGSESCRVIGERSSGQMANIGVIKCGGGWCWTRGVVVVVSAVDVRYAFLKCVYVRF